MKIPLTEALFKADKDLISVLVCSGINCKTCYRNKMGADWNDGGFYCKETNTFASAPEISVCLEWRDRIGYDEYQRGKDNE